MSNYPGTIDSFRTIENIPGQTYDVDKTTTVYAEDLEQRADAIIAIEETLGTDPQGSYDTVKQRLDAIPGEITAIMAVIYPVGSVYINATDSTNPNTLFGFGTWVAFGAGRVPVGKASSGTFGTAGATLGAETRTLTTAEMPAHNHGSYHYSNDPYRTPSPGSGANTALDGGSYGFNRNGTTTGGGGAHNNIQPSIVVYMWRRTA